MLRTNHLARYMGWLLPLLVLLVGCRTQPPPTPTPVLLFITMTPSPTGMAALPSATPTEAAGLPPAATATLPPWPTLTPAPGLAPTSTPIPTVTPISVTPTGPTQPYAIINSPQGSVNVRSGPGMIYGPPLGGYNNGARVDIVGRQYSPEGELWWLVPFTPSLSGQGWIYAAYTSAYNTDGVPWVTAPPLPPPPTPTFPP
ncbi:MAG TPA: SH3 domain-containing protein, partial [Desulfurivibrionaceae bacterium]|nr:SH3 domain-containing protein [Desulfurivibrionaceae bacterium]